jgi:hypothetical protein
MACDNFASTSSSETTLWGPPPSKHMYLGYDISKASRFGSAKESACHDLGKSAEISESALNDLFGLPDPPQSLAHLPESSESVSLQFQNVTLNIDGFEDFSI